ncbi:hypothetical protein ALC56_15305 [Trachymyrmex septentrionalis]|uniref:Double jelly roll-like domain-containing protein n=1 Tax=Trachymyrmex septentrionalis TaxID=34720 RepID=A0A195EQ90_9HYME|nr:hypothetical protein ALC56_15305 [Trachymyrmex septentrionalis]
MTDILNIKDEPIFDDRIVKIETHTYNPFANTTFGYSDEIRIPIQQQDLYTLPYERILYEGKLTKNKVVQGASVSLGNNCIAVIFDEIRYELNGVEIDRNRNVGITSTIKNYVTVSSDRSVILRNAGWDAQTTAAGYFNFCVPLCVLRFLVECFPYNEAKRLITTAVFEDDAIVYVKGREKRTWLWNLLLDDERERMYIDTLDAVYEDIESLTNLDVTNTMRCGQGVKNSALQNVLKIYNW